MRYQRAARRSASFLGCGLFPIAERPEGATVDLRWADAPHDGAVCRRDVADVRGEPVGRVERVGGVHVAVARHLRHDRGRGDRRALLVAVDDRTMTRRRGPEPKSVDEVHVGGLARGERRAEPTQIRPMEAVAIDDRRRKHMDGNTLRTAEHGDVELLAGVMVELLRVVEEGEGPSSMLTDRVEVEENAGEDRKST